MIIPTAYSYTEKQEIELARLLDEYGSKEADEGGPPEEELIDFQKLRLDEIEDLEKGIVELDKVVAIKIKKIQDQNKVIQNEQKKITAAKELLKKEWGAPPIDTRQLVIEHDKLTVLAVELKELELQKTLVIKQINTKKLLYDIQKHDAKLIGVELSKTCIAMAKTGFSSCPTYEDLVSLDDSITEISGKFSFHDGWFHREKSNYVDSFRAYDNDDKIRIIIDPPQNEAVRMKMIVIVSNFGLYAETSFATKVVDGKRLMGNERIINNCTTAQISADNWKLLLPDTIFTFRNGCESAEIDDVVEFEMPKTEIDVWSSPNIQYSQWLLEMKDKCKVKC